MNKLEIKDNMFESIKHIDEEGVEYWSARELMPVLQYRQWRRFESVINNAIISCKNSNYSVSDHFANVGKMIEIAKGGKRNVTDYKLSRYACYLIAQNGDLHMKVKQMRYILLLAVIFERQLSKMVEHYLRIYQHPINV